MKENIEKSGGGRHIAPKSKYNEVVKFFPVSVDNFFDNPDRIVKYAKSLPMKSDPDARWPGKRSELLWKIDKELNNAILLKILSCYYDLSYQDVAWHSCMIGFQEIPAFSKNKDDVRNKGWIHFDNEDGAELAGLVYLTPDIDPDSGTSLFTLKQLNDKEYFDPLIAPKFARSLLYQKEEFDEVYFTKKYKKHEEFFIEKTRFANIYNRMIMYDTNEFHRANSFYNDDGKDARLTLVFFIGGLNAGTFPLEKIREKNCDEFIEKRCTLK